MPFLTIDEKVFNVPNKRGEYIMYSPDKKELNILADNLPNTRLGNALKMVKSYREGANYKPGQSIEDIFDILVAQERETNIEKLIEQGDKDVDDNFAKEIAKVEAELKQGVVKHYKEKAEQLQNNNLIALKGNFKGKWGSTPEAARKNILSTLLGKDFAKTRSKEFQDDFLSKVAQGLKGVEDQTIMDDPIYAGKVEELRGKAQAVLDFFSTQKEMGAKAFIDNYVKQNVADDPDKFFENSKENSYDYQQLMSEIKTAKDDVRKDAIKAVEYDENPEISPLSEAQYTYLRQKQEDSLDFKNVINKRNDLVSRYQNTNIFSRIARWCLPNSWSEAGKIQNEIDKLDKAVKDAGYKKEDIDTVQKEIQEENSLLNPEAVDTKSENVIVDDEETLNMQNAVEKETVSKNLENSEKVNEISKEDVKQLQ